METIYDILKEEHDQLADLLQQAVADSSKCLTAGWLGLRCRKALRRKPRKRK